VSDLVHASLPRAAPGRRGGARWSRLWLLVGGIVLFSGCTLKRYLPEGPVLDGWERTRGWPAGTSAVVHYTSEPALPFPVPAVQVWGLTYDLDLVLVSRHPDWDMHEYARISTPQGPVWLCKDARAGTLDQSIVADIEDIEGWLPEVPVPRRSYPVQVVDRSSDDRLDLELSYENIDGHPVRVTYQGSPPKTRQKKRNGSTMGHSKATVLAVLDLPYRDFAKRASVEIDGVDQGIDRILGLVPFRMALQQTQGGLAVGDVRFAMDGEQLVGTYRTATGGEVPTPWTLRERDGAVELVQTQQMRELVYRFTASADGAGLELSSASVTQHGRATPTVVLSLSPPLPDLRRSFDGAVRSRFVLDVNGQENHAIGWLEARSTADGAVVTTLPEAPWWTADRPMSATITRTEGTARVEILRTGAAP
jgi:hypothetical protein